MELGAPHKRVAEIGCTGSRRPDEAAPMFFGNLWTGSLFLDGFGRAYAGTFWTCLTLPGCGKIPYG
jgi:hypothetical protein